MLRVAFYKGSETLFGKMIRWWDRGPYSHCELVFSDGAWATSYIRRGVVIQHRNVDSSQWDFIELPDHLEAPARKWFEEHNGKSYDFVGLVRFVLGFIAPSRDKWFCSRACADALGMTEGWREGPNGLYAAVRSALVI